MDIFSERAMMPTMMKVMMNLSTNSAVSMVTMDASASGAAMISFEWEYSWNENMHNLTIFEEYM